MAAATVLRDKSNYADTDREYGVCVSPAPSPDTQSLEIAKKPNRKRSGAVFSYHKVGPKKLRKCKACGSIKVLQRPRRNIEATCTSTSSDPDGITALDYMISECLVRKLDVPFKPLNVNIKGILNAGANKISVLDIVERQIEKSFNMKSL